MRLAYALLGGFVFMHGACAPHTTARDWRPHGSPTGIGREPASDAHRRDDSASRAPKSANAQQAALACLTAPSAPSIREARCHPSLLGDLVALLRVGSALYWVADRRAVWSWRDGEADPHLVFDDLTRAVQLSAANDAVYVLDAGTLKSGCVPGDTMCPEFEPVPGGTGRLLRISPKGDRTYEVSTVAKQLVAPAAFARSAAATFILELGDHAGTPSGLRRITPRANQRIVAPGNIDAAIGLAADDRSVYWATSDTHSIRRLFERASAFAPFRDLPEGAALLGLASLGRSVVAAVRSNGYQLLVWRTDDAARDPEVIALPEPHEPAIHPTRAGFAVVQGARLYVSTALVPTPQLLLELDAVPGKCPSIAAAAADDAQFFAATTAGCVLIGTR